MSSYFCKSVKSHHLLLAAYLRCYIHLKLHVRDKRFSVRKTLYGIPKLSVHHDRESLVFTWDESTECDWLWLSQPLMHPPLMYDNVFFVYSAVILFPHKSQIENALDPTVVYYKRHHAHTCKLSATFTYPGQPPRLKICSQLHAQEDDFPILNSSYKALNYWLPTGEQQLLINTTLDLFESQNKSEMWAKIQRPGTTIPGHRISGSTKSKATECFCFRLEDVSSLMQRLHQFCWLVGRCPNPTFQSGI